MSVKSASRKGRAAIPGPHLRGPSSTSMAGSRTISRTAGRKPASLRLASRVTSGAVSSADAGATTRREPTPAASNWHVGGPVGGSCRVPFVTKGITPAKGNRPPLLLALWSNRLAQKCRRCCVIQKCRRCCVIMFAARMARPLGPANLRTEAASCFLRPGQTAAQESPSDDTGSTWPPERPTCPTRTGANVPSLPESLRDS